MELEINSPFFQATSSMGNPATGQRTTKALPSTAFRPDAGNGLMIGGPYMLRREECVAEPARFAATQEYRPPSSTSETLMLRWDMTSPWTVTYCPIRYLKSREKWVGTRDLGWGSESSSV